MAGDFFPRRDAEFAQWAAYLRDKIVLKPEAFGLTPELVAPVSPMVDELLLAQRRASDPGTRTRPAVRERNELRKAVEKEARRLVRQIQACPFVTTVQRVELRISLRGRGGRNPHAPVPDSAPIVLVESVKGRVVHLRLMVSNGAPRRGRAVGAKVAFVFWYAGEEPPARVKDWGPPIAALKTKLDVAIPADVPPGTKISFVAHWANARFQRGPGSAVATAHVGGGVALVKPLARAA